MSGHEAFREMLELAAADTLSPGDRQILERHLAGCAECASRLIALEAVAAQLERLPAILAPGYLAERTRARIRARMAEAAEKRWDDTVLAVLVFYAWTLGLAGWLVFRLVSTGGIIALNVGFVQTSVWLVGWTLLAWVTVGVAAGLIGHRYRQSRRHL